MEVSLGKYICCVGWAVVRGSDAENYEKRAILKEKNRKTGRGDCCASPPEPQCCLAHLQCKPEHPQGCCGVSQGMTVMLQGLVAARAETFLFLRWYIRSGLPLAVLYGGESFARYGYCEVG